MGFPTVEDMSPVDDARLRLGAALRSMVAGETEPMSMSPGDGLFGPDSAVWRVHADASMLVGGIRALLVQTLHPPTMAGVADHSDYRHDPLGRLHRTSRFVGVTTYGSVADAEAMIEAVRRIHDRVEGTTPDGTPYRANDPHLLGWVHATEVDSFLAARRRYGHDRIDDATADRYVAEMAEIGRRMGVIDPPTTTADLARTFDRYRPELGVNHQTREAIRFLALPPLPLAARAPYGVLFAGAIAILPGWSRRKLWLPRLPVTEAVAVRPAAQALVRLFDWGMSAARDADLADRTG